MKPEHPRSVGVARLRTRPKVAGSTVPIGIVWSIPQLLRELGANPAAVIRGAGIDPAIFADDRNLVSFEARTRLLQHCAEKTGCPHFGLLVGTRNDLSRVGLVGLLVRFSPNVDVALHSLEKFWHLYVRATTMNLTSTDGIVSLAYAIQSPGLVSSRQTVDGAMATLFNFMRTLCGADWKPIEVQFTHDRPENVVPFRRFFAAPLRFNAEQNALVFATDWLRHRIPTADAEVLRLVRAQVDALEARHAEDFPAQVRSAMRSAFIAGQARADQVAALFSMHPRTLNRRLNAFGTSFRREADEVRFAVARQLLEESSMELGQIATMLDYSNASAFGRAFKRWCGVAPAHWRPPRRQARRTARA